MRFVAVLNRDGGSLRTIDLEAFSRRLEQLLREQGHEIRIVAVPGSGIVKALESEAGRRDIDVVLAGGGDGTISAAASVLAGKATALAVLPAGTMNLFARSLAIPLDLEEAVAGFARGSIRQVDLAAVNGRPFVHQFSLGMHARMIRLRENMAFRSRLGKIRASLAAFLQTFANPPVAEIRLDLDGREIVRRASALAVSNNLFGERQLPYAEDPSGGVLGVYITVARRRADLLKLMLNLLRGRWRMNAQVENYSAKRVRLEIRPLRQKVDVALDGELIDFEPEVEIEIRPGGLNVLLPG